MVAGGAGFIGSHLIDKLLENGHSVICVDNFFIGTRQNILHLQNKSDFTFYEQDLCDIEKLSAVFEKENIEYVFHLAANSDIQASAQNPMVEYKNTYTTTFHLLENMRRHGVKKFFFSSTSAVYGDKTNVSLDERTPELKPVSYYGAAKLGSEALISSYSYMNDFQSLVFRFPNVIGSRLTHGVIYDFINKLNKNNDKLVILGDGNQTKPYLHVADLINGIILFMNNVDIGVTTYNIGVETSTSVTTIADIICEEMGYKDVKYEFTGGSGGWKGDIPRFNYCLDKIHKEGWKATIDSNEAVRRTVREIIK
jgi:UDP-glucose 4-epimerase